MHSVLDTLIESQLEAFANGYTNTAHDLFYDEDRNKLIHPGEFGGLRESLLRDLLKNFLPEEYGVSQGFVISPDGEISNQCDVVVYSRRYTPLIRTPEHQRFFLSNLSLRLVRSSQFCYQHSTRRIEKTGPYQRNACQSRFTRDRLSTPRLERI
jgi:hypothetical protein